MKIIENCCLELLSDRLGHAPSFLFFCILLFIILIVNGFWICEVDFHLIFPCAVKPAQRQIDMKPYIMSNHTASPRYTFTFAIIDKNDKLDKVKHYTMTDIEGMKIPKLKSLVIKHLWNERKPFQRRVAVTVVGPKTKARCINISHIISGPFSYAKIYRSIYFKGLSNCSSIATRVKNNPTLFMRILGPPAHKANLFGRFVEMFLFRCLMQPSFIHG